MRANRDLDIEMGLESVRQLMSISRRGFDSGQGQSSLIQAWVDLLSPCHSRVQLHKTPNRMLLWWLSLCRAYPESVGRTNQRPGDSVVSEDPGWLSSGQAGFSRVDLLWYFKGACRDSKYFIQYLFSGLPGYLSPVSKIKIKQCKIAAGLTPSHSGDDEYQSINASACPSEGQFCIMCFVVPKKFTAGRSLSHLKCSPSNCVFHWWLLFLPDSHFSSSLLLGSPPYRPHGPYLMALTLALLVTWTRQPAFLGAWVVPRATLIISFSYSLFPCVDNWLSSWNVLASNFLMRLPRQKTSNVTEISTVCSGGGPIGVGIWEDHLFSSMWCSSVFTIFSQFPRLSPCSPWHCLRYKMLIPQHTRLLPQSTRHFHNLLGSSHSQRCFSHSSTTFHPGSTNWLAGSKPSPISSKAFSIVCRFFHNSHSFPQRMPGFVHRCYTPRLLQWAPRFHPQVLRVMMVHFLTGDKTQDITKTRKVLSH